MIWINWHNRRNLRNFGAPTLYSFKKDPNLAGIGEELENGEVLTEDFWGAELVEELQPYADDDDIKVEKVRLSGFYGTHLEQVLRTQGIQTPFFAGVNADQCVETTMEDAYFRDYNPIMLRDATATPSPDFCKEAAVFNAELCWDSPRRSITSRIRNRSIRRTMTRTNPASRRRSRNGNCRVSTAGLSNRVTSDTPSHAWRRRLPADKLP